MIAYERLCAALTTAFELMLYRSTQLERRPVPLHELADAKHAVIVATLPGLIEECDRACSDLGVEYQSEKLLGAFRRIADVPALLGALSEWHTSTQKAKGAEGKLPWFTAGEQVSVRSAYALAAPPETGLLIVHPTRLPNAAEFLSELK